MKRKLTKEEEKMCRAGINNRKKRIAEMTTERKYFEEFYAFNSKWAKYIENKAIKEKEKKKTILEQTLKFLIENIEDEQKSMNIEKDQLLNGVTIKDKPSCVN